MAVARIRIYAGPTPESSNFIGLSATPAGFEQTREWAEFFSERGYETVKSDLEDSPSRVNMEVRPPMSEEHIREFGQLAITHVDTGHNDLVVIDSRDAIPEPMAAGNKAKYIAHTW